MSWTRRDATKLLVAGASLAATPLPVAAASNEEWADRLAADLNGTLSPGCDGVFSITQFGQLRRDDGKTHLAAVVRLDWPPGFRTRRYDAIKPSEKDAYLHLLLEAYDHFRKAWPNCVL